MHVLKPHVSLNVSNIDASVACCAPSALPAQDKPVQLGKKTGCC
ncbi:MAG: hypothetical protein ABSF69_11840 [Polyangiaceae bacterium]|jgi:hypothetical protein